MRHKHSFLLHCSNFIFAYSWLTTNELFYELHFEVTIYIIIGIAAFKYVYTRILSVALVQNGLLLSKVARRSFVGICVCGVNLAYSITRTGILEAANPSPEELIKTTSNKQINIC